MARSLSFLIKISLLIFIFNIFIPVTFAQEFQFFMQDQGYLDYPVFGKVSMKLFTPGTNCQVEINFGGGPQRTLTFDCNFPQNSDQNYFWCEYEFMHVYPGPARNYGGHMPPADQAGCFDVSQVFGPTDTGVICNVVARFTCSGAQSQNQTRNVWLYLDTATPPTPPTPIHPPTSPVQATSIEAFISRITNIIYWLFAGLLLVFIALGGLEILLSAGNYKLIERGKRTLTYALLGFALINLARGIFELIRIVFGIRQ